MRKLKLQIHISIDGFVAGPAGELDWIFVGGGQQLVIDLATGCDTILIGRKMARGFIDHWESVVAQPENRENKLARLMVNMRKIIFSRSETAIGGQNVAVANSDLATTVKALKEEDGKDIIVYGGANFVSSLIEQNLIDEYHMFIIPTAIGSGLRIFNERKKLALTSSVSVNNLFTYNTYIPA